MSKLALVLIGAMGVGKTSVGRALAFRLKREFVDMDALIEAREGRSISAIFDADGEDYFRDIETEVLQSMTTRKQPFVLSTGGGVILRESNREMLKKIGRVYWLNADETVLLNRLQSSSNRPLFDDNNQAAFISLLKERAPMYEATCDVMMEAGAVVINELADAICSDFERYAL